MSLLTEPPAASSFATLPESVRRLVPFERMMWDDDRPSHPMTGVHELDLTGPLDRAAFDAALDAARAVHPLLRATIHADGWGRNEHPVVADWAGPGAPRTHPRGEYLDLSDEPGVRVWVRGPFPEGRDTRHTLTVQIHHCCADAMGGLRFLFDLFGHYAARVGNTEPPPPPDAALLATRGAFYPGPPGSAGRAENLARVLHGTTRLLRRPTAVLTVDPDGRTDGDAPGETADVLPRIPAVSLSEEETTALRSAAKGRGVTVNDLLLRDLFLVLADSPTHRFDGRPGRDFLRVCMPVNLRTPADAAMPAANKVGLGILTRGRHEWSDADGLLADLAAETAWIKRRGRGLRVMELFAAGQRLTGRTPGFLVSDRKAVATATLSNLGDLSRLIPGSLKAGDGRLSAGGVTLTDYRTAPPPRPRTRVSLLAVSYAGRLRLCVRAEPGAYPVAAAEDLLDRFAARVRVTSAG